MSVLLDRDSSGNAAVPLPGTRASVRYQVFGRYIWDTVNGCVYAEARTGAVAEMHADEINRIAAIQRMFQQSPTLRKKIRKPIKYVGFRSQNMAYAGSGI